MRRRRVPTEEPLRRLRPSIQIGTGDSPFRLLAALETDIGDGKDVGEGQAVGASSYPTSVGDDFGHFEAATPVPEEPVADADLDAHFQVGHHRVVGGERQRAGLLLAVRHLHLRADPEGFDRAGRRL
jgi:hypothetical protein